MKLVLPAVTFEGSGSMVYFVDEPSYNTYFYSVFKILILNKIVAKGAHSTHFNKLSNWNELASIICSQMLFLAFSEKNLLSAKFLSI